MASMLTVNKLIPQGRGLAAVLVRRAASVQLSWALRQCHAFEATDSQGRQLHVALPTGSLVRSGDVLVAQDGSLVQVQAAAQPVLEVRHCTQHGSPLDLLRAAYHLGKRQVPVDLQPDHLKLAPDPALADLLRARHLIVTESLSAFEPEAAGDGAGHGHGHPHHDGHDHRHHHGHDHAHDHAHDQAPAPARGTLPVAVAAVVPAPHVHGPGCAHDHGHGHGHSH